MKKIFGRTDTEQLINLPLAEDAPDEAWARQFFKFDPHQPLPLVPFVDVPCPGNTATLIHEAGLDWSSGTEVRRTWTPIEISPPVPFQVTDKQMLYWLINANLYQRVLEVINTISDPVQKLKAQTQWTRSSVIQRNHPMTLFVMDGIPLTPAATDQAFIEMSQIAV